MELVTKEQELAEWPEHLRQYIDGAKRLNIGCGFNRLNNWINLDMNPRVIPDVRHNLESPFMPFKKDTFDVILACHVLEHVYNIHELMASLYHILAPGGRLIIMTPYATSDDAFEDPHHVRFFNENSWMYFDKRTYSTPGTHGTGATQGSPIKHWDVVARWMIPHDEFKDDPELKFKARHWRNVIRELQVVMVKKEDNIAISIG